MVRSPVHDDGASFWAGEPVESPSPEEEVWVGPELSELEKPPPKPPSSPLLVVALEPLLSEVVVGKSAVKLGKLEVMVKSLPPLVVRVEPPPGLHVSPSGQQPSHSSQ